MGGLNEYSVPLVPITNIVFLTIVKICVRALIEFYCSLWNSKSLLIFDDFIVFIFIFIFENVDDFIVGRGIWKIINVQG